MTSPAFADLPLKRDGPPFNAWGLYGPNDELGRLNLITPDSIQRGAKAVKHGICVNLKSVYRPDALRVSDWAATYWTWSR